MSIRTIIPTAITPAILDTILGHLAPHFLASANGDLPAARHASGHMLAAYNAETEEELRLAAEIVSFSFHALEALSEAAGPDLSFNKKLRLRGSAVSLSRESHKSQRKLDQLRRARLAASANPEAPVPTPPIQPTTTPDDPIPNDPSPDDPSPTQPLGLIEFARDAIQASMKTGPVQAWTLSRQQRRAAKRMTETVKRNNAEQHRRQASEGKKPPASANQHGAL
ncbi:MAG: hypothetical protein QOD93_6663 [Acetobacteraceae bacterium]|nr:hypothetical protein [Acetobacteraceae bacterium]